VPPFGEKARGVVRARDEFLIRLTVRHDGSCSFVTE
jgi:hypothetical protein